MACVPCRRAPTAGRRDSAVAVLLTQAASSKQGCPCRADRHAGRAHAAPRTLRRSSMRSSTRSHTASASRSSSSYAPVPASTPPSLPRNSSNLVSSSWGCAARAGGRPGLRAGPRARARPGGQSLRTQNAAHPPRARWHATPVSTPRSSPRPATPHAPPTPRIHSPEHPCRERAWRARYPNGW